MKYRKHNYNKETPYAIAAVKGVRAEVFDVRLDHRTVPEGKYYYEVADADGDGIPARIAPSLVVNFFGTIVTDEPLTMVEDEWGSRIFLMKGDWEWLQP